MFKINTSIPQSNVEMIHSEIIKPIQKHDGANGGSCTFIFRPIGTLDLDTSVKIKVVSSVANRFLPTHIGIASVLKSATLRSQGGVIIAQNTNFPAWCAIKNAMTHVSVKKRVLTGKHGFIETFKPSEAGTFGTAVTALGKISVDLGDGYTYAEPYLEAGGELTDDRYSNYVITNDANTTAEFVISLADMFPYAKNITSGLPLDLIQDEISLVLEFSQNGNRSQNNERVIVRNDATAGDFTCNVVLDSLELLCDYIIYKDQSRTASEIYSPQGKMLHYSDLNWSLYNMEGLPATANVRNLKKYNFNLSLTNSSVRQMYLSFSPSPVDSNTQDLDANGGVQRYNTISCLHGHWGSRCPTNLEDGFKFNIRINQKLVFQEKLQNFGEYVNQLENAFGSRYYEPYSSYCNMDNVGEEGDAAVALGIINPNKGDISNQAQMLRWVQNTALTGDKFFLGVDLEKKLLMPSGDLKRQSIPGSGMKIGEAPINIDLEVLHKQNKNDDKRKLNVCCVLEKNLLIKNGALMVLGS